MSFFKSLSPKRIFRSKKSKDRSIKSNPSSDNYDGTASSSSSSSSSSESLSVYHNNNNEKGCTTPISVLPNNSSGDWSSDVSTDMVNELLQSLKLMDKNNSGIVSKNHLESLLIRLGTNPPSKEEVTNMLKEVEQDNNGCISVEALMSRIGSAYEPAGDDELKVAFEFFDTDQDGKITAEELMDVFKAIGDEKCTIDDCLRMIAEVDKNGDGFVCFDDFCRMMQMQR